MEWLIGIAVVGFLYYRFIIVKSGNLKFWKAAHANPEAAYAFFKQNSCFVVFDSEPPGGYKSNLPSGDWDGPFKFPIPSQYKVVIVYGRSPEYQAAQEDFIRSVQK